MFAGPPGTGKTSTVITLATEIFGEGNISGNLLELNASDDRGIDIIRNEVKDFAKTIPIDAPFKIISLDEADALTSAAQHALRRTMENMYLLRGLFYYVIILGKSSSQYNQDVHFLDSKD